MTSNFFKIVFLFAMHLLFALSLNSQDIVFTQFNQSPLTLNPALTGIFDGTVRASINYRNQWSSVLRGDSYKSYSASVDSHFKIGKNIYGFGATGWRDRAGELRTGTAQVRLSFSFIRTIGKSEETSHYISIGQDVGLVQKSIDLTAARWPSQAEPPVDEPIWELVELKEFNTEFLHLDMATGISWMTKLNGHNGFTFGISMHHLNRPNISFYERGVIEKLSSRLNIHGNGEIELSKTLSLMPSFVYYKQGIHSAFQLGSGVKIYLNQEKNPYQIEFGTHARFGNRITGGIENNAVIGVINCVFEISSIGLSYDYVTNDLSQTASYVGSFEMMIGYRFGQTSDKKPQAKEENDY